MISHTTEAHREFTEFHRELSGPLCLLRVTLWNKYKNTRKQRFLSASRRIEMTLNL